MKLKTLISEQSDGICGILGYSIYTLPVTFKKRDLTPPLLAIDVLVVSNDDRRTGVATKLIKKVEKIATQKQMNVFAQTVDDSLATFFRSEKYLWDEGKTCSLAAQYINSNYFSRAIRSVPPDKFFQ